MASYGAMRRSAVAGWLTTLLLAALWVPAAEGAAAPWSAPAPLAGCAGPGGLRVLFPSDRPVHRTGPGAIVWSTQAGACGRRGNVRIAAIGAGDRPRAGHGAPAQLSQVDAVATAPGGRIALAGPPAGDAAGREGAGATDPKVSARILEGRAGGSLFGEDRLVRAGPVAAASAYLDDVAFASLDRAGAVQVQLQRHYSSRFAAPVSLGRAGAPVGNVAVALDYRSDLMTAWQQGGWLWGRWLYQSGRRGPLQRIARVRPPLQLLALNSDDGHGMAAWVEQRGALTAVRIAISGRRGRFDGSQLLERYRDPRGAPPAPGSLRLIRLARESVMIAWPGVRAGHYVVRTAAVSLGGVRPAATLGVPGGDLRLDDFEPGPRNEALELLTAGPPGASELLAARAVNRRGTALLGAPERIAGPGPIAAAGLAFDPDSDVALAAWREGDALRYALRRAQPGPGEEASSGAIRTHAGGRGASSSGWGAIVAIAAAALVALAAIATLTLRARRRRSTPMR